MTNELIEQGKYRMGITMGILVERERILEGIQEIEDQSHRTKTPLFQDTLFKLVRDMIRGTNEYDN